MGKQDGRMNPYLAGGLSGLLMVASIWFVGKYFGASTTFVRSAGMIESLIGPERIQSMAYFIKEKPQVDWQWMFVLGIMLGSLLSALVTKSFAVQSVPDMWRDHFGPSPLKRWSVAFAGGALAMIGARLADGCPSGHGLSGVLQLAVSGLVAVVCFFLGGMVSARLVYGSGRARNSTPADH